MAACPSLTSIRGLATRAFRNAFRSNRTSVSSSSTRRMGEVREPSVRTFCSGSIVSQTRDILSLFKNESKLLRDAARHDKIRKSGGGGSHTGGFFQDALLAVPVESDWCVHVERPGVNCQADSRFDGHGVTRTAKTITATEKIMN